MLIKTLKLLVFICKIFIDFNLFKKNFYAFIWTIQMNKFNQYSVSMHYLVMKYHNKRETKDGNI